MSAQILDGRALAASIKKDLAVRTTALKARGITPGLGTVLVGDDPGSHSYVGGKHRDCQEVGINSIRIDLPASATQADLLAAIKDLNAAKECTGYIVQLPLPKAINTQVILEAIDPDKDADGLHPLNLGRLVAGYAAPLPCTPRAIVELINHYKIPLAGADVVVLGLKEMCLPDCRNDNICALCMCNQIFCTGVCQRYRCILLLASKK